jgi:hypothetical protein
MKKHLGTCFACCATLMFLLMAASSAQAAFHLYRISQIFSNADGTVQFITLITADDGEYQWGGQSITSTGSKGGGILVFPTDLPRHATALKSVLIATQGFADLHIVTPDFLVPSNFISTGSGSLNFAGVHTVTWVAGELPTDGVHALSALGNVVPNLAENFAGQTASVGGAPASPSYQGLWWKADEAGWGVNFAHQGDRIFATWYTYDTAGNAYWLTMLATATVAGGNTFKGDINLSTGPAFNNFTGNVPPATKVGDGTITFSDANTGTFAYNLNVGTGGATTAISQVKPITRFVLVPGSPQPVCSYQATPDLNAATNYQDLWWLPSESGWGANFAHQGNLIYATWYTYDAKVAGNNAPLWLSALVTRQGASNVFVGPMYRTAGARFDNFKASDVVQPPTTVGTATLTFADGNHAAFHYVTNGAGNLPMADQTKQITRILFAPPATTVCQ